MANEIWIDHGTTGVTLYFVDSNATGSAWNGTAYATYTTTRGDFDIAMTEVGVTGRYRGTLPAQIGLHYWRIYLQAAGSPSHANDTALTTGSGYFDGTDLGVNAMGSLLENTETIVPDPNRTWVVRRDATDGTVGSTKAIPKVAAELIRLYVDFSRMLGTNEALGAITTLALGLGSSGITVASSSYQKSGNIVSFTASGGTVSATAYNLTVEMDSDTGDPLKATVQLKVI